MSTYPAGGPAAALHSHPAQRFLVTGGRGFIGSHLVARLLADGHEVHAVTRSDNPAGPASRWWRADLADAAATTRVISSIQPHVVVHLAARAAGDRTLDAVAPMVRDNVLSSVNVMSAVSACAPNARVVVAGSVEEPRSVSPGHGAHSPYAAAKAANTTYATLFRDLWQLPITVLRLAMVYGPGDPNTERLIPHAISSLVANTAPQLSSGNRPIDWVYVDDVVDALLVASATTTADGAVIDIGSGTTVTIRDTVERAAALAGSRVHPVFGAAPERPQDRAHIADISLAREILGWTARIPLDEGLRRTIDWYRQCAVAV